MTDVINVGSTDNDGNGDTLRAAFSQINTRFNELLSTLDGGDAWATGVTYTATPIRQWVINAGQAYVAAVNHVSGASFAADLAAGKWYAVDSAQILVDLAESTGAGMVGFAPTGTIASTTVQTAIAEINTDLAASSGASLVGYLPAGTGAVATDVQSKLRESVSVFDFMTPAQIADVQSGAASVDVTVAIQAAIDASNSVFLPEGSYLISAITINKNYFSMFGTGNASVLVTTAAANVAISVASTANVSFLRLENFKIQGNATNLGGVKLGTAALYVAVPIFKNLHIWDFSLSVGTNGYGIQLNSVQNADFENCWVYRNRHGLQRLNTGYCTSTRIHGKSSYLGEGYIGLFIDGQTDDIYIEDAVIEGNNNSGILVTANAVAVGRGSRIYVNKCYFELNNASGGGTIYATGASGAYQDHNIVVDQCQFAAYSAGPNIALDRVTATISNNVLTPSEVTTTATCTVRFDRNKYPSAANYLSHYRALLGNIIATDFVDPATSSDLNQVNLVNAVSFPAAARPVADVNTLDDYQEGTWTPSPSGFGGTGLTASGNYTKIGKRLFFEITFQGTSITSAWPNASLTLPMPVNRITTGSAINVSTGETIGAGYIENSAATMILPTFTSAGAVLIVASGHYEVAE